MRVQLLAHGRGQVCVDRISNKVMSKREPIIHLDQETGVLSLVEQGQQIRTRSPITAARSATEKTDPSTDANRRRLSASDERKRSRLRKSNSAAGTE
jgi:hypothetical protein